MFRVDVITLFPGLIDGLRQFGVSSKALAQGVLCLHTWNPRDFTRDPQRTVDDRPYGGGPGMVLMHGPLRAAIAEARRRNPGARVSFLSPQGRRLEQCAVRELVARPGLILLAGRYAGVDQRLLDQVVDEEWSIGDYVLSGGELAALVLIDTVIRMLPGALGNADSVTQDSFQHGLLGYPQYTRPESVGGQRVPEVLLGGDHARIRRWRLKQALGGTWLKRPDLLSGLSLDTEQSELLSEFQREYQAQQ